MTEERTEKRGIDWDESYPVYSLSNDPTEQSRAVAVFTVAEIAFIDKAEADYDAAQNLIEKRLGYRP